MARHTTPSAASGGIFDISNHNSLGKAREIGLRSRYDRQLHEGRLYINQPALTYFAEDHGRHLLP